MTKKTKTCAGSPQFPECREPFISRGGPRKYCTTCQDAVVEGRDKNRERGGKRK